MQSIATMKRQGANNEIFLNLGIVLGIAAAIMLLVSNSSARCPRNGCVSNMLQQHCPFGSHLLLNRTVNGCCPGCVPLSGLFGTCQPSDLVTMQCAPGLACAAIGVCLIDSDACFSHLYRNRPDRPSCLLDGSFGPVQCKGDRITGRCFCSDSMGNRIFGTAWRSQITDMTCACSHRRNQLELSGRTSTLHCTSDGSYEPLQCDDGLCWCAEPKTGEATTMVVPELMMEMLPCYSEIITGSQYLRQCESLVVAQAFIHKEQARHGTVFINEVNTFCDYDGSFGLYQILNGIGYCSARNGSSILSFQTTAGSGLRNTTCFCARDVIIYQESGLTFSLSCSGTGNYMSRQQAGGRYYCVDRDGFPITGLADFGVDLQCPAH